MARSWKFRIKEVEGLYYLCSENKGADQLRGYREADLRLCFCICENPVFSRGGSYDAIHELISDSKEYPQHMVLWRKNYPPIITKYLPYLAY